MPADMAPSPMTATTLFCLPCRSRATAMPRPAEIEVEEWAAPNGSYSLATRLVNLDSPPPRSGVRGRPRLRGKSFVRIGLMAHIPDDLAGRRVDLVVDDTRTFDDAGEGAEMAAFHCYSVCG